MCPYSNSGVVHYMTYLLPLLHQYRSIVTNIYKQDGMRGYIRGLTATWARDVPGYFTFFTGKFMVEDGLNATNIAISRGFAQSILLVVHILYTYIGDTFVGHICCTYSSRCFHSMCHACAIGDQA